MNHIALYLTRKAILVNHDPQHHYCCLLLLLVIRLKHFSQFLLYKSKQLMSHLFLNLGQCICSHSS